MKKFGLLGKNISYSFSPILHSKIMNRCHINGTYSLYDVSEVELADIISLLRTSQLDGLNVTIPYKIKIMDYLDEVSSEAQSIGSVNCIARNGNKIVGYNTDYFGIIASFKKLNLNLNGKKVLILGTGGAARAVFKVLKDLNSSILIATRNKNSVNFFPKELLITYPELESKNISGYLIINCTPLGSNSFLNESPVSKKIINNFQYAFDLIYNPPLTKFLSFCKLPDNIMNGFPMLIAQAIKSQEIWNNKVFNITIEEFL